MVCHGDFHPDNVILAPRGLVVIDWTNAVRGDSLADVARTSVMLTLSPLSSPLMRVFRNTFYAFYLRRYRQLRPFNHADLARWLLPVAAARLDERIPGEETALLNLIQTAIR
jgi:aminoglycoside phosphotransferase (APT) family kinase protein